MPTKDERGTDEDIGRPGPWGESRYHKPGSRADQSVLTPPGTPPGPAAPVSTPVTRKDYEFPAQKGDDPERNPEPPGGDAG